MKKLEDYIIEEKRITETASYFVNKTDFEKANIEESDWIEPKKEDSKVKKYKLATWTLKELYEARIKGDDWKIGRLKKFPKGIKITFMIHIIYHNNPKAVHSLIWRDMVNLLKEIDEDDCILLEGKYNPEANELRVDAVSTED